MTMKTTAMMTCAWCAMPLRGGVGHGICPDCSFSLTAWAATAAEAGEWVLPPQEHDIDGRWLNAFIATRLQDVLARRYYATPFPSLSVEDRTIIRSRVESFLTDLERELAWSGRVDETP